MHAQDYAGGSQSTQSDHAKFGGALQKSQTLHQPKIRGSSTENPWFVSKAIRNLYLIFNQVLLRVKSDCTLRTVQVDSI